MYMERDPSQQVPPSPSWGTVSCHSQRGPCSVGDEGDGMTFRAAMLSQLLPTTCQVFL